MIHKITAKRSEKIYFANKKLAIEKRSQTGKSFSYKDVIVKKPWGYEYLVFENDHVAIWMLHIVRKRKTSMHCHPGKRTSLVLVLGKAKFYHKNGEIELNPMDGVVMEKGVFHSTEAFSSLPVDPQSEDGIWVMEIESPPLKTDLVRTKDTYGRTGSSYEGPENMVYGPKKCLKIEEPILTGIIRKELFGCAFTARRGSFVEDRPGPNVLVSVIRGRSGVSSNNPYLRVGGLVPFGEFSKSTFGEDLEGYTFLTIEKEKRTTKLSHYIFSCVEQLGVKQVFAVSGGGAMHLVDSLGGNRQLEYVATYHEQAAAMAAEGYARISGKPGVCLVTSGPGGTNTITGVYGAWIDSIPTIFISGQVTTDTLLKNTGLRQFGIQEGNIIALVRPITKYAVTVTDPATIKYHFQKAIYYATTGRPGPVWLDIPLDIQSSLINPGELDSFTPDDNIDGNQDALLKSNTSRVITLLKNAKRPVLVSGYGIRLAKAEKQFLQLVNKLKIPVISSWTTSDLIYATHKLYIGRSGIMGDRAGNFTVQNADLLLIIGSRMSIPQVGYNYATFAREAKKIMVDIDPVELKKKSLKPDLPINADAKAFMIELIRQLEKQNVRIEAGEWIKRCRQWKNKYPVILPEYASNKKDVNSYYFIDVLSKKLDKEAIIVTDMGTSFTCTMQVFRVKKGQRLFTSSGHAPMGFGLPGAIGACFGSGMKKTICISGDGGLQMNIQELQTLVHYNLPIILFVLNNKGYLTIKLMQQNHFGRYVGSESSSGVSFPDIIKVARAYGIKSAKITNQKELHEKLDSILAEHGPFVCEIVMPENQLLIPRTSSIKKPDGTIVSRPLEDLWPFLSREEFKENMIVKMWEPLK